MASIPTLSPVHAIGFSSGRAHVAVGWRGTHTFHALGRAVIRTSIRDPSDQLFLSGHSSDVCALCVSPDSKWLVSAETGDESDVLVWNLSGSNPALAYRFCEMDFGVLSLSFSPDSRYFAVVGAANANRTYIVETATGAVAAPVAPGGVQTIVSLVTFGPNVLDPKGRPQPEYVLLAAVGAAAEVWIFDPRTGRVARSPLATRLQRAPTAFGFDSQGGQFILGTETGDLIAGSIASKTVTAHVTVGTSVRCLVAAAPASALAAAPSAAPRQYRTYGGGQQQEVFVGGGDGSVSKWLLGGPQILTRAPAPVVQLDSAVTSLSPLGGHATQLLAGTAFGTLGVVSDGTPTVHTLSSNHSAGITSVAFYPADPAIFVTASYDGTVRFWDSADFACALVIPAQPEGLPTALCFAENVLIVGYDGGSIVCFDAEEGTRLWHVDGGDRVAVRTIRASRQRTGDWIFIAGGDAGEARVWSFRRRQLLAVLKEHRRPLTALELAQNGDFVFTSSADRTVLVWDVASGTRVAQLRLDTPTSSVVPAPDARTCLVDTVDGVGTWTVAGGGGGAARTPVHLGSKVSVSAFANVGGDYVIAYGEANGAVDIVRWTPRGGLSHPPYQTATGIGHCAAVSAAAVSPDGNAIVTGDADGAIMIWLVE